MEELQEKPLDPESLCQSCGRCCHRKEFGVGGKNRKDDSFIRGVMGPFGAGMSSTSTIDIIKRIHGKTVFLKETCPNLIETPHEKAKCKIYDHRFRDPIELENGKFIRCLTPEQAFQQGLLPTDCPYVYYFQHGADKKLRSFVAFNAACDIQDWDGFNPKPEKNCKHCYGRGYTAQNALTKSYVPCVCLSK